jgi:hypothetical protein
MVKFIAWLLLLSCIYGTYHIFDQVGFVDDIKVKLDMPTLRPISLDIPKGDTRDDIFVVLILISSNGMLTHRELQLGESLKTLRSYLLSNLNIINVDYEYDEKTTQLLVYVQTTTKPKGQRDLSKKWLRSDIYLFNKLSTSPESTLHNKLKYISKYGCKLAEQIGMEHNLEIVVDIMSDNHEEHYTKNCNAIGDDESTNWVFEEDSNYVKPKRYVKRSIKPKRYVKRTTHKKRKTSFGTPPISKQSYVDISIIKNNPAIIIKSDIPDPNIQLVKNNNIRLQTITEEPVRKTDQEIIAEEHKDWQRRQQKWRTEHKRWETSRKKRLSKTTNRKVKIKPADIIEQKVIKQKVTRFTPEQLQEQRNNEYYIQQQQIILERQQWNSTQPQYYQGN